ncbi:MAG: ABC transporter substrate-binding protein, partial [Proteobacteria bacterium]|nr:ABC transporter substrate-binding protein [Pseudomonadota bacterium]
MKLALFALTLLGFLPSSAMAEAPVTIKTVHALSLEGEPEYGPDFTHFNFADPDAPKGGHAKLSAVGGFDSLNPFIVTGVSAGLVGTLVYEGLM